MSKAETAGILGTMGSFAVAIILMVATWFTHVVNCIQDEQWFLLVIGILAAPIGWVHGLGIWFGWFV